MKNIMTNKEDDRLVLAIDPAPRGFGYVLIKVSNSPLDGGVAEAGIFRASPEHGLRGHYFGRRAGGDQQPCA